MHDTGGLNWAGERTLNNFVRRDRRSRFYCHAFSPDVGA